MAAPHQPVQNAQTYGANQNIATSVPKPSTSRDAQAVSQITDEQIRQIHQILMPESTTSIEPTIQSDPVAATLEALTTQSIEQALAHVNVHDYTFLPEHVTINSLFSSPNSPPIYKVENDNRPYVCITANGFECLPLLDSGSMVCIIVYKSDAELQPLNGNVEPCSTKISTISRENSQCTGLMFIKYGFCGQERVIPTLLFKSTKSQFIVGINFWHAFGITVSWKENSSENTEPLAKPIEKSKETTIENSMDTSAAGIAVSCETIIVKEIEEHRHDKAVPGGILHVASIASSVKRAGAYVPRWRTNRAEALAIQKPTLKNTHGPNDYVAPIYTSYESIEPEHTHTRNTEPMESHSKWSPVQVVLAMLREMPMTAHVSEVQVQTSIRTAEGAFDSVNDVLPEKHTCISQPHDLTPEQRALLNEVLKVRIHRKSDH